MSGRLVSFAHGLPVDLDGVCIVHEPVKDGIGNGGIADRVMPELRGELARDEGAAGTVPVIE